MMKVSPDIIGIGDVAGFVRFTGAAAGGTEGNSQEHPLKVEVVSEVVAGQEWRFECLAHPQSPNSAFSGLPNNAGNSVLGSGICAAYAGMGLKDLTASSECGGVYGLEVAVNSTGNKIYVTALPSGVITNDIVYFQGSDPSSPVIDQSSDSTITGSTKIQSTGTDGTGSYIVISTTLNAEIPAGTTVVAVPDTYGTGNAKYLNREYCVIPLNTAPPFGSTESGLITTTAFKNLIAREIAFDNMHIEVPSADVVSLESAGNLSSVPNRYLAIKYITPEGVTQTWKALINDNLTGI